MNKPTQELYQTLEIAFDFFNQHLFDGELPPVLFTVQRKQKCMGYFSPERWASPDGKNCHELAINPAYVSNNALIDVMQTLVHEMAHEWQHCFGKTSRNGYHNKQWSDKMISIGLMPSETGMPGGARTGQNMSDYPMKEGKFIRLCIELVSSKDFALPWIDKYAMDLSGLTGFDDSIFDDMDLDDKQLESANALTIKVSDLLPDTAIITHPKKISLKTTYRCSKCKSKLWGKSGLKVQCLSCGVSFKEQ